MSKRQQLKKYFPHVEFPLIVQAPMAYTSGGDMAGAVSAAGGLGFIGAGYMRDADWIRQQLEKAESTVKPGVSGRLTVGVGLITWHLLSLTDPVEGGHEEAIQYGWQQLLARVLELRPAALWLSFGDPVEAIQWVRTYEQQHPQLTQGGRCPIIVQVQSVKEACQYASNDDIDIIVAQGSEAGGHGARKGASVMSLVPEMVDAVAAIRSIPILAAGGIADGRGIVASLALGADAAVIGTRYMATPEALGTDGTKRAVVQATDGGQSTLRTDVFDVMRGLDWPVQYDIRALNNQTTESALSGQPLPSQTTYDTAAKQGDTNIAMVCAGQSVGLVQQVLPAGELTRQLRHAATLTVQSIHHHYQQ